MFGMPPYMNKKVEKRFTEEFEKIKAEGEERGYLTAESKYKNLVPAYEFICTVGALAGKEIPQNKTEAELARLSDILKSEDYNEYICLYRAMCEMRYDDAIAEIRQNSKRKNAADIILLRYAFSSQTDDEMNFQAFEIYEELLGADTFLVNEVVKNFLEAEQKANISLQAKYSSLIKKIPEKLFTTYPGSAIKRGEWDCIKKLEKMYHSAFNRHLALIEEFGREEAALKLAEEAVSNLESIALSDKSNIVKEQASNYLSHILEVIKSDYSRSALEAICNYTEGKGDFASIHSKIKLQLIFFEQEKQAIEERRVEEEKTKKSIFKKLFGKQ